MPPERLLLLGSAVLTTEGRFEYRLIPEQEAVELLRDGADRVESFVGHATTAALISELAGVTVGVRRDAVTQQKGEAALVARLAQRASQAGELDLEALRAIGIEWGILERVE